MMTTVVCGLTATLHRKSASNETNRDRLWNSVEHRGAILQSRSARVIRPVTPDMFRNRLKRGANDAYNDSHIHAPTLKQGHPKGHPNCVNLRSFHQIRARHEISNK
jgi:hypothetical protein